MEILSFWDMPNIIQEPDMFRRIVMGSKRLLRWKIKILWQFT